MLPGSRRFHAGRLDMMVDEVPKAPLGEMPDLNESNGSLLGKSFGLSEIIFWHPAAQGLFFPKVPTTKPNTT